jgi:hypothetical protein
VNCPDYVGPPSSATIHYIAQTLRQNKTIAKELKIRANFYYGYKISFGDLVTLIQSLEGTHISIERTHKMFRQCYSELRVALAHGLKPRSLLCAWESAAVE